MLEALRLVLVQGTVGVTLLAAMYVILKQGPQALRTVMRERTRLRLIRLALEADDEEVRKRARGLLTLLESATPDEQNGKRPPDSIYGPDG